MITQHQLEHEYSFTPNELLYLQTTQRLAEAKMQRTYKKDKVFTEAEEQVWNDLHAFGFEVRGAIESGQQTISIKMGVIWWLISIWNTLTNLGHTPLDFIQGDTRFKREDVARMHFMFIDAYSKSTINPPTRGR